MAGSQEHTISTDITPDLAGFPHASAPRTLSGLQYKSRGGYNPTTTEERKAEIKILADRYYELEEKDSKEAEAIYRRLQEMHEPLIKKVTHDLSKSFTVDKGTARDSVEYTFYHIAQSYNPQKENSASFSHYMQRSLRKTSAKALIQIIHGIKNKPQMYLFNHQRQLKNSFETANKNNNTHDYLEFLVQELLRPGKGKNEKSKPVFNNEEKARNCVINFWHKYNGTVSLDHPLNASARDTGKNRSFHDTEPDENQVLADQHIAQEEESLILNAYLTEAIARLKPKQRGVLLLRQLKKHQSDSDIETNIYSYESLGEKMGCTRERARQIETQARKMVAYYVALQGILNDTPVLFDKDLAEAYEAIPVPASAMRKPPRIPASKQEIAHILEETAQKSAAPTPALEQG